MVVRGGWSEARPASRAAHRPSERLPAVFERISRDPETGCKLLPNLRFSFSVHFVVDYVTRVTYDSGTIKNCA